MRRLLAWTPGAWLLLFGAAPLGLVLVFSFLDREEGRVAWRFSTAAWRSILVPEVAAMLARSAAAGLATCAICLLLGGPVAWFLAGCGPRSKRVLVALLVAPALLNALSRTTALKLLFQWAAGPSFHSMTAVVAGLVYAHLPLMILPLWIAAERIPRGLLEAASDLGEGPAGRFRRVVLPLAAPGIAAGALLVFIPSFGAFVGPAVLGPVDSEMAGVHVAELARGNVPAASALSVLVAAACAAPLLLRPRGGEERP